MPAPGGGPAQGRRCAGPWRLGAAALGLWLLRGAAASVVTAGGEAWLLTNLAEGDAVPLLVKVSTSGKPAYDELTADLGLLLQLESASAVSFLPGYSHCKDLLFEAWGLPAPRGCVSSGDGRELRLTFFRDEALRPATDYFFTTRVVLLLPRASVPQRTVFAQTYADYWLIDSFGFVLPSLEAPTPGPRLGRFEVAQALGAELRQGERFALHVTLAAESDGAAVDIGREETVMIWAMPLAQWDFSGVGSCAVEIGTEAGTSSGLCRFLRFPASEDPVVRGTFGLNAIELTPGERIGAAPKLFRLSLAAPTGGGALAEQHRWLAQPLRAGRASQQLLAAPFGIAVQASPQATVGYAKSAAASARNEVVVTFATGLSFSGPGLIRLLLPEGFALESVDAEVLGFGRVAGEAPRAAVEGLREAVVELPMQGAVYTSARYALRLDLRNPPAAALPPACAEALAPLGPNAPGLGDAAATASAAPAPAPWRLEVAVGALGRPRRSAAFSALGVVPALRSAALAPSEYAVGKANLLTVLLRLSVGLLTAGASLRLAGPEEYRFSCGTVAGPWAPLTTFPVVETCGDAPGLLLLTLKPGEFLAAGEGLSFQVGVQNPSLQDAIALERRSQSGPAVASLPLAQLRGLWTTRSSWSIALESRRVACQAQADVESPYGTEAWRLFHYPLFIDGIHAAGVAPHAEVLVTLRYRFSNPMPRDSLLTFLAPSGFEFLDYFDVERSSTGAEATLNTLLPVVRSGERPHEVSLRLGGTARPGVGYGLRAKVKNPGRAPGSEDTLSLDRWRLHATLPFAPSAGAPSIGELLGGRHAAGSREGLGLAMLQACKVEPGDVTFGQFNEVVISFVVHTSIYSSQGSAGRIRVAAPEGYEVPAQCGVREAVPTLEKPQGREASFRSLVHKTCAGAGNLAVIQVEEASAVPKGSHVRFRLGVLNAAEDPPLGQNRWVFSTTQGVTDVEACELPAPGFALARPLERAACHAAGAETALRPGARSVYRLSFVYPVRTAEEEAQASGHQTRSQLTLTAPEGFQMLAACLEGAGDASVDGEAQLPPLVACVGTGRVAHIVLAAMIVPQTQYVLSIAVDNPPSSFSYAPENARWMVRVDNAARGGIEPPTLRLLRNVRLLPGDTREGGRGQWTKLVFQTSTGVPVGGGLAVLIPYAFRPDACADGGWGLYDAGAASPLGGAAVAVDSPCQAALAATAGQRHRLSLYPLSEPLPANRRYLLALRVDNGAFAAHDEGTEGWSLETSRPEGSVLDSSRTVASFRVHRAFGHLALRPPALPVAAGELSEVGLEFELEAPARRGAVVLRPPPSVRVHCGLLGANATLPAAAECTVEGDASDWEGQRMVLSSRVDVWASRKPYKLRILVEELGHPLPAYRRAWRVQLVAGRRPGSWEPDGFVLGATAEEQWTWRGKLLGLAVGSASPAVGRRYRTVVDFAFVSPLFEPGAELWVRPPAIIMLHEHSCAYKLSASSIPLEARLAPLPCDMPPAAGPCLPKVWETGPCRDEPEGAGAQEEGFAHRHGLRLALGALAARSFLRLGVDATPLQAARSGDEDGRNVWTVSTWQDLMEQDVAQAPGYAVRHWIDVTRFAPSSLEPEAEAELAVELWLPAALPAGGRLVVRSPSWRGDVLFDLLPAAERFDFGNLPRGPPGLGGAAVPPGLEALTVSVELRLCCALEARTTYHFGFGLRNPPFERMPSPLLPELNLWSVLTHEPSGEVLHQQAVQGYRLIRAFRSAGVALSPEHAVGGVAASSLEGQVLVAVDFSLPLGSALHGPAPSLRLQAPLGWQFPPVCHLEDVRLGPRTRVAGCRAAGRDVQLLLEGEVYPGVEGRSFGFIVAARPPAGAPASDMWVLEGLAHVGSPEGLLGLARPAEAEAELELRFSSYVPGLPRPGGLRGEIEAWVQLSPRMPRSLARSWRAPAQLLAEVQLQLPAQLPLGLANATLRVGGPAIAMQLRCAIPPEPFMAGNLPPGVLCYDFVNSRDGLTNLAGKHLKVDRPSDVVLAVEDLIPLRSGVAYSFSLIGQMQELDYSRAPEHSLWPSATTWSLLLTAGGELLRTAVAAAPAAEGVALPDATLRDFGLQTTTTEANALAEVSLLFSTASELLLPLALEVLPPPDFRLDSELSPLHPALRPLQHGVNPFRSASWSQRAEAAAAEATRREAAHEWPPGTPCPHFGLNLEEEEAAAPEAASWVSSTGLCAAAPTLESSLLRVCKGDTYEDLPQIAAAQCTVLAGRAVIWLDNATQGQCVRSPGLYSPEPQCVSMAPRERLPPGQYRLRLRGYNPPQTPADAGGNVWTLTVFREAEALGGGRWSLVRPVLAAQAPGYEIDRYEQGLAPGGGVTLRGGSLWHDTDGGEKVLGVRSPAWDETLAGRRVNLSTE